MDDRPWSRLLSNRDKHMELRYLPLEENTPCRVTPLKGSSSVDFSSEVRYEDDMLNEKKSFARRLDSASEVLFKLNKLTPVI